MHLARVILLLSWFVAGCVPVTSAAPTAPLPAVVATQPSTASQRSAGDAVPAIPEPPSVVLEEPAAPTAAAVEKQPAVRAAEPPRAAPASAPTGARVAPQSTPVVPAAAAAPTSAKPAPQPAPVVSAAAAAPTLDLNALKEQLKDTRAIGIFTKLSLKNQVDDLLEQFRAYYKGNTKITMAQLRRSYDLLLMKVLSLIQDTDQKLASAIVNSRDAIWGLLSDPKKFSTLET